MYIPAWPSLSPVHLLPRMQSGERPFPLNRENTSFFYVARNGIYQLFRGLGFGARDLVLVPNYHHGNEIYAIRAANVPICYYPINLNLELDLEAVTKLCKERRPRALYITHFIGWPQPVDELLQLCREYNMMLIEDCALSFMSCYKGRPLGSMGEYAAFCLYKSLPLPNGGALVQNGESSTPCRFTTAPCSTLSVAARSIELMLQWIRMKSDFCGKGLFELKRLAGRALSRASVDRVPVGNTGFDVNTAHIGMSGLSKSLLQYFNYERIRTLRRRNFQFLQNKLREDIRLLPIELGDDVCPLFFPLLVRDKEVVAQALWSRGIEVVQFWNTGDPEADRDRSFAQFLRRHVLEVPIHQDVTTKQLDYTARQIRELRKNCLAC